MRARFALVLPAAGIVMILAGCSDMGDPVSMVAPPPGRPVSYSRDVVRIFTDRGCLSPICHGDASSPDRTGMLTSYGRFVGVPSFGYGPNLIVKPGDPDASVLYNKIENTGLYGQLMPFGAPQPIPQSERDLIRDWILQGALNN